MNPEGSVGKQLVEAQPLNLSDDKGPYRKGRELNKWGAGSARADRPTMYFPIPGPNNEDVYPIRNDGSEGRWRLGKPAMMKIVAAGNALFEKRDDGTFIAYEKIRSAEPRQKSYRTLLTSAGTAAEGTAVLKDLFGGKSPFDFPKPPNLIRKLIEIAGVEDDDLVLDFFAGSGTTGHAILDTNRDEGGNRRFILIQLPETLKEGDFKSVAEITKERVRRAIKKITEDESSKLQMDAEATDYGFKSLKLQTSNFKAWNADLPKDAEKLGDQMEMHIDHIEAGRTAEDILFELLLKSGFPLSTRIESLTLAGKTVYSIAEGAMLICLDKELNDAVIKEIAARKPERVVCLDAGFAGNDQLKTNTVQTFKSKGVVNFKTV